jgi:hypothetical protein
MYETPTMPRDAGRLLEVPAGLDPALLARLALARVRKVHASYAVSMSAAPPRLAKALEQPFREAALERERLFALGWLRWLEGDLPGAAGLLGEGERRAREAPADEPAAVYPDLPALEPGLLFARLAYWNARVRNLLEMPPAVGDYEGLLRRLGGSPQATAWYVDLLWRAGRVDRAEQVWKSVRGNKRVLGCDEGPLLEARVLLRRGELGQAEKVLREAAPGSGVVWVERYLLWAWALAGLRQLDRAAELLAFAQQGPYPARALALWQKALDARREGRPFVPADLPAGWRDLARGQQARAGGQDDEAEAAYRAAQALAVVAPFARHGLVCLGKADAGEALATAQGAFFVVRLRARHALERFRRREIEAGELLDALHHAQAAGYGGLWMPQARQMARLLQEQEPTTAGLGSFLGEEQGEPARRNALRLVLEVILRRLPPPHALALLRAWTDQEWTRSSADLRQALEQALLNLRLRTGDSGALDESAALVPAELWSAAGTLAEGQSLDEPVRERLAKLREEKAWRALAQALLVQDAAGRGDVAAVEALLEEHDVWRNFGAGPPRFILRALEALALGQPSHPAWRRTLPAWLGLWGTEGAGAAGASLAALAGMASGPGEAPPGIAPTAWFLHQAARAVQREDARLALACIQKAGAIAELPEPEVVPLLARRAAAQALAGFLERGARAELLVDMVDLLKDVPGGEEVLRVALEGNGEATWEGLEALAGRPGLPGRLYHHLAVLATRRAEDEERPRPEAWGPAWRAWLGLLTSAEAPPPRHRDVLLEHLLAIHRRRINDLLGRNDFQTARLYWEQVQGLPALSEDLAGRVARFRDDLATEYLVTTREAMRFGDIPEGWRADYERGLALLQRLLSLDGENERLLTALVETCNDWFLDLYHLHDAPGLRDQVDRFTPFALQLARLIEDQPGAVAARSALADFWKARGFLEFDRQRKVALYREALQFNPSNQNVRDLLAELEEPEKSDD